MKSVYIRNRIMMFMVGVILLISFFTGGFLISVNIPFVFFVLLYHLKFEIKKNLSLSNGTLRSS